MKQIFIAVPGAEGQNDLTEVQIFPGTKARDVLAQLKLSNFQLNKAEGGAYGFNDDLYPTVTEGQKLFVSKADVKAGHFPKADERLFSGLLLRPIVVTTLCGVRAATRRTS